MKLLEQELATLHNITDALSSALPLLYWHIGHRIRTEVLGSERATYGEQIVSALPRQLEGDYGRGFYAKNLRHMLRFVEAFPDAGIVSTLSRQFPMHRDE